MPPLHPPAQTKKLEALGLSREQAEALTRHLTTVLCANKEKLEEMYASKVALEKVGRLFFISRHDCLPFVLPSTMRCTPPRWRWRRRAICFFIHCFFCGGCWRRCRPPRWRWRRQVTHSLDFFDFDTQDSRVLVP